VIVHGTIFSWCSKQEFAAGEYAVEPLKDADPTAEFVELTSYVERRLPGRPRGAGV